MKVEQILEKKRALLAEIERTRSGIDHLPSLDGIYQERRDAVVRMKSSRERYGASEESWPVHVRTDYRNFNSTVERADAKILAFKEKKTQLDDKMADLMGQLAALDPQVTVEDLLPLQATVNGLLQKLENMRALAAEEEKHVDAVGQVNNSLLAELTNEKEGLLADIACGESDNHQRLKELDLEISQEEERRGNQSKELATSSQKIAGINRKIDQATGECTVAKRNLFDGLALFLEQELEKAGAAYVKQAGNLAGAYSKVIALSEILAQCGAPREVFGPYTRQFKVPSFLLDTCMAHEIKDHPGVLFRFDGSDIRSTVDSEIERICRLGININDGL